MDGLSLSNHENTLFKTLSQRDWQHGIVNLNGQMNCVRIAILESLMINIKTKTTGNSNK